MSLSMLALLALGTKNKHGKGGRQASKATTSAKANNTEREDIVFVWNFRKGTC